MRIGDEIRTERLIIRSCRSSDLEFAAEMWFDEENGKYMSDPTREFIDGKYQRAFDNITESADGYYMTVLLRENGELAGTCCVFPEDSGCGAVYDIGYCIHKRYWRTGLGTELVNALTEWIRKRGGERITAEVAVDNTASNALLKKCGFEVARRSEFKKYNMDICYKSLIYQKRL